MSEPEQRQEDKDQHPMIEVVHLVSVEIPEEDNRSNPDVLLRPNAFFID